MTLRNLLAPGGDPWKLVPYALLLALIGVSGQLVVALQFREYLWAFLSTTHALYCPLLILVLGHAFAAAGLERVVRGGWAVALVVVAGCLLSQVLMIEVNALVLGRAQTGIQAFTG